VRGLKERKLVKVLGRREGGKKSKRVRHGAGIAQKRAMGMPGRAAGSLRES